MEIDNKNLATNNDIIYQLQQFNNDFYTLRKGFFKTLCIFFINLIDAVSILQLVFVKTFTSVKNYSNEIIWV